MSYERSCVSIQYRSNRQKCLSMVIAVSHVWIPIGMKLLMLGSLGEFDYVISCRNFHLHCTNGSGSTKSVYVTISVW